MKWPILTIILGFLVTWQLDFFTNIFYEWRFLILGIFIFWYFFIILKKRISISNFPSKFKSILLLIITSSLFPIILFFYPLDFDFNLWYYPIFLGILVFLAYPIRWIINRSIKDKSSFGIMSKTKKGEMVRSKSEKIIADWLTKNKIEYEYEKTITLSNNQKILSDFYLPKEEIYVEYWGMSSLNNETGESYRERKWEKQNLYKMDNIKLIELYPHHIYELDSYLHEQIKSFTENKNTNWLVKNMFPKKKKKNEKPVTKKPFNDNVPFTEKSSKPLICNFCNFSNSGNNNYCEECGNKIQS
jgi:hypothetical protein